MWGYYDGWSRLWMAGMMVVFWGAIIALAVWAVRSFGPRHQDGDAAIDTLRKRFAAGEISQEEFDKTKRPLQS